MADARELADAIEVLPDRLYWVALQKMPQNTIKTHYFYIDDDLVYEPFFADFGPLNISMVYRYCRILEAKLKDPELLDKRIVHFCSHDPKKRSNAAFLICAYQVIAMRKAADLTYRPFLQASPPFLPFRDATTGPSSFNLTILDCLHGLEKAIEVRWFDWTRFDLESYDFFEKVDNGDMNWVIPDKMLAFAGPCPTPTDADGYPAFMPEDYVPIFKDAGIGLVVRLNKKQYDRLRFIDHGVKHVDLYFVDGSCPSIDIINKFLHIVENEPSAIAIHCKAGLGRTGSLIGMYAMKHFSFAARSFIAWNRICRPGSILGPQQQFLCDMQAEMWQAGAAQRRLSSPLVLDSERSLANQMAHLSLRERTHAEQVEDFGQGDRLCGAKRNTGGGVRAPGLASRPLYATGGANGFGSERRGLPPRPQQIR